MNPGFETQKYLRPSIVRGKRADFVGTIHQTAKTIPFTLFSEGMHWIFLELLTGEERNIKGWPSPLVSPPPSVRFPDSDHQIAGIDIDNGTFFPQFCRFGYKTLCYGFVFPQLIFFFFLFGRFSFDSFLLWVFGLSIKMFVFSILDICFCFVFFF